MNPLPVVFRLLKGRRGGRQLFIIFPDIDLVDEATHPRRGCGSKPLKLPIAWLHDAFAAQSTGSFNQTIFIFSFKA